MGVSQQLIHRPLIFHLHVLESDVRQAEKRSELEVGWMNVLQGKLEAAWPPTVSEKLKNNFHIYIHISTCSNTCLQSGCQKIECKTVKQSTRCCDSPGTKYVPSAPWFSYLFMFTKTYGISAYHPCTCTAFHKFCGTENHSSPFRMSQKGADTCPRLVTTTPPAVCLFCPLSRLVAALFLILTYGNATKHPL